MLPHGKDATQHLPRDRAGSGAASDFFDAHIAEGLNEPGPSVDCPVARPGCVDRISFRYRAAECLHMGVGGAELLKRDALPPKSLLDEEASDQSGRHIIPRLATSRVPKPERRYFFLRC